MSLLEQVQADATAALKAGERERANALRLVVSELQKDAKENGAAESDEVAVLQRERKRRLESAEAYAEAGRNELAQGERFEVELIERYLPAQVSDDELGSIVAGAIDEAGASSPADMGKVMGLVMPRVQGRADGKRVSAVVREQLA